MTDIAKETEQVGRKERKPLLILLFLPCLLIYPQLNNDIWFLLNSGRYVLEHGIPHIEPFTMHEGMSFVMQQWLSAVVFWRLYSALGQAGLFLLICIVYVGTIIFTYRLCMRVSDNHFIVSYILTFLIGISVSLFMVTRPMIFTALIIVLELYLMESHIASGKLRYLAGLPLLSLLQINLHAAMWPMLFVILLPYIIDSFRIRLPFVSGQGYARKPLLICIAIMLLLGLVNPYGLDAVTYLSRSYGYSEISNGVLEMLPADINDSVGKLIFGEMLLIIAIYSLYKKGRSRIRFILLSLGTAYMALSSVRNYMFFIICGVFPLAYYLKEVRLPHAALGKPAGSARLRKVLISLIAILVIAASGLVFHNSARAEDTPEVAAAINYILENESKDTIVLYTGYGEGGYAEFMGLRPYIDPRAEVFVDKNNKKSNIMKEFYDLQSGALYYRDVLDKYGFTDLVVSKTDILSVYLPHDPGYNIVFEDEKYYVFKKKAE